MKLTLEQRRNLDTTGRILVVAFVVAIIYVMFSDGFISFYPYINALIIAPAMTLLIAFFEFVVFTSTIRKKGFRVLLILRVLAYTVSIVLIILFVLVSTRMFKYDAAFNEIISSQEFQDYLKFGDFKTAIVYVFGLVILTNFTIQMSRKMGQGVLWGLALGKYRTPREVERFLMFLKLQNAGKHIQQMGNETYLNFINEVLYDITDSIVYRKGVIVEYVDSEILISWRKKEGQQAANCIRTFFDVCAKINREKLKYSETFRAVPALVASLHFGKVICGEVGIVKSELVYSGDTMNSAYRIMGLASQAGHLVMSSDASELLKTPSILKTQELGQILLRGKQEATELTILSEN